MRIPGNNHALIPARDEGVGSPAVPPCLACGAQARSSPEARVSGGPDNGGPSGNGY
jgi:hypothetical protein